jgi:hypothetical protein
MRRMILTTSTLACVVMLTSVASAYDGDWKRGRVYYQGVCTPCHKATANPEGIPANNYTIAEWTSYLAADKHGAGKDTVKQYVSQSYRTEIKAKNKVAERFFSVADQDLLQDVKAFVINGAKDGDAPAGCN